MGLYTCIITLSLVAAQIRMKLMKSLCFFLCFFLIGLSLRAQDSDNGPINRKGSWIIETGSSIIANVTTGGSTGGGVLFDSGNTITNIGINTGKFISDELAIKFNLSVLSVSSDFGSESQFTIMAGPKYYISGVAPIDISAGIVTGGGDSSLLGKATIGYGIRLADNINFEPGAGLLYSNEETAGLLQFTFALFL